MKKLAIISTGLFFGFFVFLTGFPMVDNKGVTVALAAPECTKDGRAQNHGYLTSQALRHLNKLAGGPGGQEALLVMVLGPDGNIKIFSKKNAGFPDDPVEGAKRLKLKVDGKEKYFLMNVITTLIPEEAAELASSVLIPEDAASLMSSVTGKKPPMDPCMTLGGRTYCWP